MPLLCGLITPTFNRQYMPQMRRASFSIGGVISLTRVPTRITYADRADEISELGCRDLQPDSARGHCAISGGKSDAAADRSLHGSMHRGPLSSGLLRSAAADFWGSARLPAHRRSGQQGPRVTPPTQNGSPLDVQLTAHFRSLIFSSPCKGHRGLIDQVENLVLVPRGRFSLRAALWLGGGIIAAAKAWRSLSKQFWVFYQ